MAEDRLDRLERRVRELETLVRTMQPLLPAPTGSAEPIPTEVSAPSPTPESRSTPSKPRPRAPHTSGDAEQWVGQRGLLAVGVILLILAAAYLLKLAIDRGWISPALRCMAAAASGVVVAGLGWRQFARGLRTYGAALIGTGAALVYLALWAATRLFALIPEPIGMAGLTLVSLGLAGVAYFIEFEVLAAAAALGALFAPAVIGVERATSDLLLLYVGTVGQTLGWAAVLRRWRVTANLIALTYFGFGLLGADGAVPANALAFAVAGGLTGMTAGLKYVWTELRLVAFLGAWGILGLVATTSVPWMLGAGAALLAVPVWLHASRANVMATDGNPLDRRRSWTLADLLCFYLTPALIAAVVLRIFPVWCAAHPGGAAALVAVPYLVAGYTRPRTRFAAAAALALTIGAVLEWSGVTAVFALLALALVAASADHLLRRQDGRWYALLALCAATIHLMFDFPLRGTGPAFLDAWALAVWAAIALMAALALGLWRLPSDAARLALRPGRKTSVWSSAVQQVWFDLGATLPPSIPAVLWTAAGTMLLVGITNELDRWIRQAGFPAETARLASGLSISAWWTLFAGGLVILGFRRNLRSLRIAGLLVAGLTVLKVVAFDLAQLDALYRVASVFILGTVSLLVAYLYHRRAGNQTPPPFVD